MVVHVFQKIHEPLAFLGKENDVSLNVINATIKTNNNQK